MAIPFLGLRSHQTSFSRVGCKPANDLGNNSTPQAMSDEIRRNAIPVRLGTVWDLLWENDSAMLPSHLESYLTLQLETVIVLLTGKRNNSIIIQETAPMHVLSLGDLDSPFAAEGAKSTPILGCCITPSKLKHEP